MKTFNDYFYQNHEYIKLDIKKISSTSFNSEYGKTYNEEYITPFGGILHFTGITPAKIPTNCFIRIRATIKHDSYKKRTILKDIKVI